mgnify:CR=1 FL=1
MGMFDLPANPWQPQTNIATKLRELYVRLGLLGNNRQQDIQNAIQDPAGVAERLAGTVNEYIQDPMSYVGGGIGHIAYHGSPYKFDKFSLDKIGTGEGAQAYGHGLYLAEHPEVATQYSKMFDKNQVPATQLQKLRDAAPKGSAEWSHYDDLMKTGIQGSLYKTDIPDEAVARFLDWDKSLSQQHPDVQSALGPLLPKGSVNPHGLDMGGGGKILDNRMGQADPTQVQPWVLSSGGSKFGLSQKDVDRMVADYGANTTGENAYTRLTSHLGGQDPATEALRNAGIPGIRYLDGGSRGAGQGSSNFVAFDPELIRILERNGIPTGNQPWKPGEFNIFKDTTESAPLFRDTTR